MENSSCNIDGGDSIIIYVLIYFKNVGFISLHSFFSESYSNEIAYVLEALGFLEISCLRRNLKNAQNCHVSIKNACFLYEKTQIESVIQKMDIGSVYLVNFPKKGGNELFKKEYTKIYQLDENDFELLRDKCVVN